MKTIKPSDLQPGDIPAIHTPTGFLPKGSSQGLLINDMLSTKYDKGIALNAWWTNSRWEPRNNGASAILSQDPTGKFVNLTLNSSVNAGSPLSHLHTVKFYNETGNIDTDGTITAANFILDSQRSLKKNIQSISNLSIADIPLRQFSFKKTKPIVHDTEQ